MSGVLDLEQEIRMHVDCLDGYSTFGNGTFDAKEYANAILAGERTSLRDLEPVKEDISVAISQLNAGIEDVTKQIKNVVSTSGFTTPQLAASPSLSPSWASFLSF